MHAPRSRPTMRPAPGPDANLAARTTRQTARPGCTAASRLSAGTCHCAGFSRAARARSSRTRDVPAGDIETSSQRTRDRQHGPPLVAAGQGNGRGGAGSSAFLPGISFAEAAFLRADASSTADRSQWRRLLSGHHSTAELLRRQGASMATVATAAHAAAWRSTEASHKIATGL